MKTPPLLIFAAALFAGGTPIEATAQDEVADQMLLCMQLRDDAERLACFDRLSRRSAEALELGARPADPAALRPEGAPQPAEAPAPATAERAETDPAAREAEAPGEARFGFERSRAERSGQPDSIHSRVPGLFLGWTGDTVFRLENGQVWRQVEPGSFGVRLQDPEVEIARGWLGGFFLSVEGLNRRVRVERVE
jgi:hypothetical protein